MEERIVINGAGPKWYEKIIGMPDERIQSLAKSVYGKGGMLSHYEIIQLKKPIFCYFHAGIELTSYSLVWNLFRCLPTDYVKEYIGKYLTVATPDQIGTIEQMRMIDDYYKVRG